MAKKKGTASQIAEAIPVLDEAIEQSIGKQIILVFKVTRPVTDREFEIIETRLRNQEEKSGVKIVLMPYSVDLKEG
jgi:hypothetical protein